ncbi:MAG TPA: T9SS type A sorting domain-containing protein, partial [Bacteroidota bacterium]
LLVDGRVIGMRGSGSATIPGPQSSVSVRIAEQETKPVQYSLGQNYPNPFNPKTVFPFVLAHPSVVTLKVYDIGGREVATLLSRQSMGMGRQQAEFDASMLSSGVYLYRLIAEPAGGDKTGEGFEGVRKMLLLR